MIAQDKPKSYLPLALKVAVSLGLLAYLLSVQIENTGAILEAMTSADPRILVLALSLNVVGYLLCSWRWQLLLRAQSFLVPLAELVRAYTIGIFFNSFLPGVMSGDLIRALDISDRVPSYTRSFLILFVERLTGMFGLLILAVLAIPLIGWTMAIDTGIAGVLAVVTCVLVALTAIFFSRHFRAVLGPLTRTGWLRKLAGIVARITETSEVFAGRKRVVLGCVAISIVFQANVVFHYYLIGLALGIDLSPASYFVIVPVSLFVMMIPASVNGIGIREQIFIYLFGQFGVAAQFAVSVAWIAFAMVMFQAVAGAVLFALRRRKPKLAAPVP